MKLPIKNPDRKRTGTCYTGFLPTGTLPNRFFSDRYDTIRNTGIFESIAHP